MSAIEAAIRSAEDFVCIGLTPGVNPILTKSCECESGGHNVAHEVLPHYVAATLTLARLFLEPEHVAATLPMFGIKKKTRR